MANLQIKGIDENLYSQIKKLASAETRSVSPQIIFLTKEYLAKRRDLQASKSPARVLLELSGSWVDERTPQQIIVKIKGTRRSSKKLRMRF